MLDRDHIVCPAPRKVAGVLALGVQRVGGDDRICDLDAVQQDGEQRDLVGLGTHLHLAQHHAMSMIEGGEQVAATVTAMPRPA